MISVDWALLGGAVCFGYQVAHLPTWRLKRLISHIREICAVEWDAISWRTVRALILLACAVATPSAAREAAIYMLTTGIDAPRILLAHFDFVMEIRPAWWVLAAGLAVAATGTWRYRGAGQQRSAGGIAARAASGATQVQSGS